MGGQSQLQGALGRPLIGLSQTMEGLRLPLGWTDGRTDVQTYRFPLCSTGPRPPLGPKPKKAARRCKLSGLVFCLEPRYFVRDCIYFQ